VTVSAIHHKDQPRGAFKVLPPLWAKLLLPLASQVQHSDGGVLVLQGFHLKAFKWRARRLLRWAIIPTKGDPVFSMEQ